MTRINVVILGSGPVAHCYAGLLSNLQDVQTGILTITPNHAQQWSRILASDKLQVTVNKWQDDGPRQFVDGKPHVVSNDATKVIPGTDIILFVVEPEEQLSYLNAIGPHLEQGTIICHFQNGCHGGSGWLFPVLNTLGIRSRDIGLLSFALPLQNCDLINFGKTASFSGFKSVVSGGAMPNLNNLVNKNGRKSVLDILTHIHHDKVQFTIAGHVLGETLGFGPPYVHASLMYGKLSQWKGDALESVPFLYREATQIGADMVAKTSEEAVQIRAKLEKLRPGINLSQIVHKYETYKQAPDNVILDKSSLLTIYHTHQAVKNVPMPTTRDNTGQLLPDLGHAYITDDVPNGLLVVKGVAQIVGVATPHIDEIILWAQAVMNKEYLVNGKLVGRDIKETRCPQSFGLKTLKDILGE